MKKILLVFLFCINLTNQTFADDTSCLNRIKNKFNTLFNKKNEQLIGKYLNSHIASKDLNLDEIKTFIEKNKESINIKYNDSYPLEIVLDRDEDQEQDKTFEIVKILLENGANINLEYNCDNEELPLIFDFLYLITDYSFYDYMILFIKHGLIINNELIERIIYHKQFAKTEEQKKEFDRVLKLTDLVLNLNSEKNF
ncbi:MAG: hypothetical protein SZ59_C0001G0190 [candidate division TM6 bacterium GW2011_GWF2_28_16]|nr:MAG: hypothetical protein SZ59_C0001G0190 [candidate division TM6 bacterium GW2011_GWF2_28_16]